MTNDEIRMTKEFPMTNFQIGGATFHSGFDIFSSFGFSH